MEPAPTPTQVEPAPKPTPTQVGRRRSRAAGGERSAARRAGARLPSPPEVVEAATAAKEPPRGHGPTPQPRLPLETVDHELPLSARTCPACGEEGTRRAVQRVSDDVLCVHCRAKPRASMDHAIPKSWYPDGTPNTAERPTAPACTDCNQRLSKIEQELRRALALQLAPRWPYAKGIAEKVEKSMNADDARDESDRNARAARRSDLFAKVVINPSRRHAFPSLHPRANYTPRRHVRPQRRRESTPLAISINDHVVQAFGEKVIRGIAWHAFGDYIPERIEIKTFLIRSNRIQSSSEMIRGLVAGSRRTYDIPPGVFIEISKVGDDGSGRYGAVLEIRLWEHFCFFVTARLRTRSPGLGGGAL